MREPRVAARYALALFKIALKSGNIDLVAIDLNQLRSFSSSHKGFLEFLLSPSIGNEEKMAFLRTMFTTRLAPQLLSFFDLLLRKHRINLLSDIAVEFERLLEEHQGLIKTKVVTAVHIDDETKNRLKDKLEKISGKKIEIIHRIDRSIIGGVVVYMHNHIIDRSVKRELEQLRHDLLKVKVF
jgi:F-type H+-transporting ATPase subunit delta